MENYVIELVVYCLVYLLQNEALYLGDMVMGAVILI